MLVAHTHPPRAGLLLALILLAACQSPEFGGEAYPIGEISFPMSIETDPGLRYAFVTSSNFDLSYRAGALGVIDLLRSEVVADRGVEIGSFAGDIALRVQDGLATDAYVPVREGNLVTWIEIGRDEEGTPTLRCAADGDVRCDDEHVFTDAGEDAPLGDDPYGATVFHDPDIGRDVLLVTELVDGGVSVYTLADDGRPEGVGRIELGLSGLGSPIHVPSTGRVIVPNKFYNVITIFDVDYKADPLDVLDKRSVSLPISLVSGDHYRRAALIGDKLYVLDHNSERVVVVDVIEEQVVRTLPSLPGATSIADAGDGLLVITAFDRRRVGVVDVGSASLVRVHGLPNRPYDVAVTHQPDLGLHRAYFTSFVDHRVGVLDIDPESDRFLELIALMH